MRFKQWCIRVCDHWCYRGIWHVRTARDAQRTHSPRMGVGHSFSASDLTLLENVALADTRTLISAHSKTKHLSIGSNASNSSAISHGTAQGSRMRADISRVFRPFGEEYVLDMDDVLGTGGCAAKLSSSHALSSEGMSAACRIGAKLLITRSTHRYAVVRRATHRETHKDFAVKIMSIGKAAEAEPPAEEEAVDGPEGLGEKEDEQQFLTYEQVINEIDLVQVSAAALGHPSCAVLLSTQRYYAVPPGSTRRRTVVLQQGIRLSQQSCPLSLLRRLRSATDSLGDRSIDRSTAE